MGCFYGFVEDYWVDFYGEYRHRDHRCDEIGETVWKPVRNGALAAEAEKVNGSPFERSVCPVCWSED